MMEQRGFEYGVLHLLTEEAGLISSLVASAAKINLAEAQALMNLGSIYLQSKRCFDDLQIPSGSYLRIHTRPRRFPAQQIDWKSRVVFENEDFLMLNKPQGIPCHPTVDNYLENCLHSIQKIYNQEIFLTHRLDVPTQGLLLFAKNKNFQSEFNQLLSEGQVQKYYRAHVEGIFTETKEYVHYMQPSPRAPKVLSAAMQDGWQECRLKVIEATPSQENGTWLRIQLLTGRTHQIRAQMSFLGFPIWGDPLYGSSHPISESDLELYSAEIEFPYSKSPDGQFRFSLTL